MVHPNNNIHLQLGNYHLDYLCLLWIPKLNALLEIISLMIWVICWQLNICFCYYTYFLFIGTVVYPFSHLCIQSMFLIYKVEVLWSKGINRLPPLFPLLVKGRNLYKMRTFRRVTCCLMEWQYYQVKTFPEVGLLECFLVHLFSIGVMNQKE